jgi:hypothetical protein
MLCLPGSTPFQLAKIDPFVFRAPVEQAVQTSFGIHTPALGIEPDLLAARPYLVSYLHPGVIH